jgi:hypothetical protein
VSDGALATDERQGAISQCCDVRLKSHGERTVVKPLQRLITHVQLGVNETLAVTYGDLLYIDHAKPGERQVAQDPMQRILAVEPIPSQ